MIVAVLESRCGLNFGQRDIYLNVAGGLKIVEPAADLAVAAALVSALKDQPLDAQTIYFGEVALSGNVRSVTRTELRLKEAARLGFKRAVCHSEPDQSGRGADKVTLDPIKHLREILA